MKILLALAFLGVSYVISLIMLFSGDAAERGSRVGKAVCAVMVAISFAFILPFVCYTIHDFFFRRRYDQCLNDEIEYKCKLLEDAYSHQDCDDDDDESYQTVQTSSDASTGSKTVPLNQTTVVTQGYCKLCGSPLNAERKCTSCGKQYFHIKRGVLLELYAFCVTLVLIACVYENIRNINNATEWMELYHSANTIKLELEPKLEKSEKLCLELQNRNDQLSKEFVDLQAEKIDIRGKLNFYEKYAVLVTETGMKYHKADCYHMAGKPFYVYDLDAAKNRGYTACADCWEEPYFGSG